MGTDATEEEANQMQCLLILAGYKDSDDVRDEARLAYLRDAVALANSSPMASR